MDPEIISSETLSNEMAYLFGVFLTDGCVTAEGKFLLQVIDSDFAERTLNAIKKVKPDNRSHIFERMNGSRWNKNRQFCISAGFTELKPFFEGQTGKKHHIPFWIWDAPLSQKKWFVAGVMDGDGWISKKRRVDGSFQFQIGIGGVEDGWSLEFKEFLEKLGAKPLKLERALTKYGVPFVRFNIHVYSFIKAGLFFTIKRKVARLNEAKERPETKRSASYGMKI